MKRYIPVVLLSIFTSLVSLTSVAFAQTIEFENVSEGVASLKSSGVLVDDKGTVATVALHQANPNKAVVVDAEGKKHAVELISHDTISRVTLYKLPEALRSGFAKLGKIADVHLLNAGDTLIADPADKTKMSKMVSFVRRFNGRILPVTFIRVNVDNQEVAPGSPVYNTADELVGLAYQPTVDKKSIYVLPTQVVVHMRESASFGKLYKPSWVGLSMDHLSDAPQIIGVRPETPAKNAGLQKGDIIISIGGNKATSYSEVVNAFYFLKRDQPVEFKVLRGTEVKKVLVTPEVNPMFK